MKIPTRRDFFKVACSSAATAVTPSAGLAAHTHQGVPDWWSTVIDANGADDTHSMPWLDTFLNRQIASTIDSLHVLLLEAAPDGVDHLKGMQWSWIDGIPVGVWTTGRAGFGNLLHYRPEFDWTGGLV